MSKLNLAILDGDVRYMENFAGYITAYYRHRFNVFTFSNRGIFENFIRQKDSRADILLVAAEERGEWLAKLESGIVILLSGGTALADGVCGGRGAKPGAPAAVPALAARPEASAPDAGIPYATRSGPGEIIIDRYSGADSLVSQILKIYSAHGKAAFDAGIAHAGREGKIGCVISAEGGCGRTSVAVSLCSHFARLKLRTLYINLDFSGVETFAFGCGPGGGPGGAGGGLSEIVYAMKARPDRLGVKLEALGMPAQAHGFYYFAPPAYPMDIDEIQPPDVEFLVARLRGAGLYDRAVFDTHSGLSSRNKTLIELSDDVFIIAGDGGAGREKLLLLKGLLDRLFGEQAPDIYKRCHIIVNCPRGAADGARLHEAAAEYGGLFSAKVSVLPYCAGICGDYGYEALAGISNGFGAAVAEIAHRV